MSSVLVGLKGQYTTAFINAITLNKCENVTFQEGKWYVVKDVCRKKSPDMTLIEARSAIKYITGVLEVLLARASADKGLILSVFEADVPPCVKFFIKVGTPLRTHTCR